jgi:hypothetical protein
MKLTGMAIGLAAVLALGLGLAAGAFAVGKSGVLRVQVKHGEVRASASPLGEVVGIADFGDNMVVLEEKGAWVKVTKPGLTGWMHSSALTKDEVKIQGGQSDAQVKASSGEQALAGKGFTKEIESSFRDKNKNANFEWVDKMEEFKVTQQQSAIFAKDGCLKIAEGGAQ